MIIDSDGRECSQCGDYHAWSQHRKSLSPTAPYGKSSECNTCRSANRRGTRRGEAMRLRLKRAGLTMEDWDWLLAKQGGVCYLCAKPETRKDAATLSVDHDHVCHPPVAKGQTWACKKCIRALLCHNCNHMIGLAELAGGAVAERFADYLARRPFVEEGR